MTGAREDIYSALFAKWRALQGAGVFTTVGRRLFHWTDVDRELCPALFQAQEMETAETNASGIPLHWRLHLTLYVYVWAADLGPTPTVADAASPSPALNVCLDAVETALKGNPGTNRVDLGLPGKVQHCFINGDIRTDEGTLGDRAVAMVPVVIVAV